MTIPGATPAAHAIVAATLMIAHQIAGKATRDALFLSQFDVSVLPKVVMGAAVMSTVNVSGVPSPATGAPEAVQIPTPRSSQYSIS